MTRLFNFLKKINPDFVYDGMSDYTGGNYRDHVTLLVKKFQIQNGINPTGAVGPKTLAKINSMICGEDKNNLKTYTNNKFLFTFEYPNGYTITNDKQFKTDEIDEVNVTLENKTQGSYLTIDVNPYEIISTPRYYYDATIKNNFISISELKTPKEEPAAGFNDEKGYFMSYILIKNGNNNFYIRTKVKNLSKDNQQVILEKIIKSIKFI